MLEKLPDEMVAESLCGWDVVHSVNGEWKILEINHASFYTLFERGFHCSGDLQDLHWGFARVAGLLRFIEKAYNVQIAISPGRSLDCDLAEYYW